MLITAVVRGWGLENCRVSLAAAHQLCPFLSLTEFRSRLSHHTFLMEMGHPRQTPSYRPSCFGQMA